MNIQSRHAYSTELLKSLDTYIFYKTNKFWIIMVAFTILLITLSSFGEEKVDKAPSIPSSELIGYWKGKITRGDKIIHWKEHRKKDGTFITELIILSPDNTYLKATEKGTWKLKNNLMTINVDKEKITLTLLKIKNGQYFWRNNKLKTQFTEEKVAEKYQIPIPKGFSEEKSKTK